ncbi:MAG: DoxX family protein [Methylophilaceae bacterium]|nr:DoxX family protein [Methylophilaceae bacterium]
MEKLLAVVARVLLAQLFLVATIIQLGMITGHPEGYTAYRLHLGQYGLPGIFAPLTLVVQLLGSIALLVGYKTRLAASVLAGYALFVAFVMKLHEPIAFLQYLAIAGGMLLAALHGPGPCSLDSRKQ